MSDKYWIKLYHEILTDPKMGKMRDRLWRRTIEMFLFAGRENDEGTLPSVDDMAWALHVSPEQLETEMGELSDLGILDRKEGTWVVTRFAERQAPSAAALRMRRYRARKKKEKKQKKEKEIQNTDTDTYRASRTVRYSDVTGDVTRYAECERGVIQEFGAVAIFADKRTDDFAEKWQPYIEAWLKMADGDAEKVVDTVRDVLKNDRGEYTIASPKSIRAAMSRELSGKPAGAGDVDAAWETVRNAVVSHDLQHTGIKEMGLPPDIERAALAMGTSTFRTLSQYTETKLKQQFATALQRERANGTSA